MTVNRLKNTPQNYNGACAKSQDVQLIVCKCLTVKWSDLTALLSCRRSHWPHTCARARTHNARRAPRDLQQHHRSPKKESSRTIRIVMEWWSIRISAWLPVKPSQDPEINTNTENASQNTAYLHIKNASKCCLSKKLTRICDFLYRNYSKPHQIGYFTNLSVFTWAFIHSKVNSCAKQQQRQTRIALHTW